MFLFNVESIFTLFCSNFLEFGYKNNKWTPITSLSHTDTFVSPCCTFLFGFCFHRHHSQLNVVYLTLLHTSGFKWAYENQSHYRGCYQSNLRARQDFKSSKKLLGFSSIVWCILAWHQSNVICKYSFSKQNEREISKRNWEIGNRCNDLLKHVQTCMQF